jgi:hypothetical protein
MAASCKQSGCPFAETGKCLEGFDPPTQCPNYLADGSPAPPAGAASKLDGGINLPAGTAFDPVSVYEVAREDVARVVVLAGEQRSGKTTLLASLYELFQEGPVGPFAFAGSKTLPAFEERCHDARMASGRDDAETERTKPAEGFRFLHLALLDRERRCRRNLLIGDMSGELYDSLRDSSDECKKYDFVRRSDHFVAMLNGAKLAEGHHAETYNHARGLVRSLLDAGVLRSHSRVTLLTTKWDLIMSAAGEKARGRVAELEQHFRDTFSSKLQDIRFERVAARPRAPGVSFAYGLDSLIGNWLGAAGIPPPQELPTAPSEREFDRFVAAALERPGGGSA